MQFKRDGFSTTFSFFFFTASWDTSTVQQPKLYDSCSKMWHINCRFHILSITPSYCYWQLPENIILYYFVSITHRYGVLLGNIQKATRALWFTDTLLWNFPSTKPLFGCSEQGSTQTLPGDQLWIEKKIMCLSAEKMLWGVSYWTSGINSCGVKEEVLWE